MASGVVVGAATAPAMTQSIAVMTGWTALVVLGSVIPDIDKPRSYISRSLGPVTAGLSWCVRRVSKPRGITHSLLGIAAFTALVYALLQLAHAPVWIAYALALGCVTHSVGDCPNKKRVQLLWPFGRGWCLGIMRVGGWRDVAVVSGFIVIAGIGSYAYYW